MRKKIIVAIVFLICILCVISRIKADNYLDNTYAIFGYITNDKGEPIEGVKVSIGETTDTKSNEDGFYNLSGIISQNYNLIFDYSETNYDYAEKIEEQSFRKIEKNIETAFIYSNSGKLDKEENLYRENVIKSLSEQIKNITLNINNENNRNIMIGYSDDEKLEQVLEKLTNNPLKGEDSLWYYGKKKWKSIYLYDKDKGD